MIHAALLALAILSQPVPMTYGIAECSGWPLIKGQLSDDGIEVLGVRVWDGRATAYLRHVATGRRANMQAWRLGQREVGWTVWAIRTPTMIAALIAASPQCRAAFTWVQVLGLPQAARDWISERATCCGTATWRGVVYTEWPCIWSSERSGEGSVSSLTGIAPGIVADGIAACQAVQ